MNYTEEEVNQLKEAYERALHQKKQGERVGLTSAFGRVDDENLVKWQLELDNILERIDHLLRGHKLSFENGNTIWVSPTDKEEEIFNEYGVNEILRVLTMYLNRNTILSNYTEDQIELKVYDIGCEVADLIEGKYEDMGLTSVNKMKLYPLIVRELIDVVHSAYLRALKGGERESLREARSVTQTQPMMPGMSNPGNYGQPMQARGVLNPLRYISSKYK